MSSRPPRDQAGSLPRPLDTLSLLPASPDGRTKTSLPPDSLETYAIQFPSGENAAADSLNGVSNQGRAGRCPSAPISQMSEVNAARVGSRSLVVVWSTVYAIVAPSGDQAFANAGSSDGRVRHWTSPAPSERFTQRAGFPIWNRANPIRLPSGDQTGLKERPGSGVNTVRMPRSWS